MSGEIDRGGQPGQQDASAVAPGLERLRELLTGRLTLEALEETALILSTWAGQAEPTPRAAAKEVAVLLDGAGQWIAGWQGCLEELRSRRAADEFGPEWGEHGRTLARG